MKTIIFYIRNTSQFRNYIEPYARLFLNKNYRVFVFHTNSLSRELSDDNVIASSYETIDVGNISTKKVVEKIKSLKPDGIIVINFISLFDLLINRIAKKCNVVSIYMEHGLILSKNTGKYITPPNKLNSLTRLVIYLYKYFCFSLISGNFFKEIKILLQVLIKKNYSLSRYDAFLFYARNGYDAVKNLFLIKPDDAYYSGYPISDTEITDIQTNETPDERSIIYLHQPHVFHKISNCTYDEEYKFLRQINSVCNKYGYKLIIKLHPLESLLKYNENLKEIDVIKDGDLPDLIKYSSLVLGHYSTALFIAVKLQKPIILIKPDCFEYNDNFKVFENIGFPAYTFVELENILKNNIDLKEVSEKYARFQEYYFGHDNNYLHRVETLIKIMEK